MRSKQLKDGSVAYFWEPPRLYIKQGFTGHAEPLGANYATATERAKLLTAHLDAWRTGRNGVAVPEADASFGTVAWLFDQYLKSRSFENKVGERSRYEYRRALERIEDLPTKIGGTVGGLSVASITPGAVDKIYGDLQIGKRGKRTRQANLSIDIARHAWKVVRRLHSRVVPAENPWFGVERDLKKKTKPAATRAEAYALAYSLKDMGEPHLGAAALICFEWHQRPEHVLAGDITWADWRPADRPDAVFLRHPKTGEKGWWPLQELDEKGNVILFFPEIEAYLRDIKVLGVPIVLTPGKRGPARPYSMGHSQRCVRKARKGAKLGGHVTLDACRHGGLTELGDAGVTEQEGMAASMHKTPQALRLYVKRNEQQRMAAARKRRGHIAKAG